MPNASRSPRIGVLIVGAFFLPQLYGQFGSAYTVQAECSAALHRPGAFDEPGPFVNDPPREQRFQQRDLDPDTVPTPSHGGVELRIWANAMSFFSRTIAGATFETSYRWPGTSGEPDGHFSIGVQVGFWPSVGYWNSLPFDIGTINDLRLDQGNGEDGTVRFGNITVQAQELFLVRTDVVPITLTGRFRINPVTSTIFEYERTRITNMRMKMAGLNVPIRWYFGEERKRHPRYFVEGGFGSDLLLVAADYEVRTQGILWDEASGTISFIERTISATEPLDGDVSSNVLFSHASAGGGVNFGRFTVFGQGRFLLAKSYVSNREKFTRVRGNVLAIPVLAGAGEDPDLREQLERDGIVTYGRMDLTKANDQGTVTASGGLARGVSRFWDTSNWIIGLAYKLY